MMYFSFCLVYFSHSPLVFTQYGIGGMWERLIDSISRTMITSKKESIVISTENLLFAVLVAHLDIYDWRSEAERNQSPVRVIKILYA